MIPRLNGSMPYTGGLDACHQVLHPPVALRRVLSTLLNIDCRMPCKRAKKICPDTITLDAKPHSKRDLAAFHVPYTCRHGLRDHRRLERIQAQLSLAQRGCCTCRCATLETLKRTHRRPQAVQVVKMQGLPTPCRTGCGCALRSMLTRLPSMTQTH